MARTTVADTIVIVDDELHNLEWMIDYLAGKKISCLTAENASDAISILSKEIYRAAIIDLNIPISADVTAKAQKLGDIYVRYPGLYVAYFARNRGYRDRQTVVYSVHRDESVNPEARRLGFSYLIKGRPKDIKRELDEVIAFDPTA